MKQIHLNHYRVINSNEKVIQMEIKKKIVIALLLSTVILSGITLAQETMESFPGEELEERETYDVPLLGEVSAEAYPIAIFTFLIAFVDGLNPCSLWVLAFLLGIVMYAGRKKVILVGLTFLIVTASIYGLFIAGALTIFHFIAHLFWIRLLVALIAIFFAIVSIKDFFWYKKGLSFSIPEKYKPGLFAKLRGVMKKEGLITTIAATAGMAAGVALVELPCTAGLPMVWSQIIAERAITTSTYIVFLAFYVLIYLAVELVIYFSAVWRMKKIDFGKTKGRIMKLVGGSIMMMLGLIMLVDHTIMESIGWTLIAFAVAISAALITAKLYIKYGNFEKGEDNDRIQTP